MPQPTPGDVHISSALTNVAVAFVQDADAFVAGRIFPIVPVQKQSDVYWKFSKDDFLRDEAKPRADATESAGVGFNLSTGTYTAQVYGLHKDLGDQVRANSDPGLNIEARSTEMLVQKMLIKRDRLFMQKYMTTGLWGTDITGVASGAVAGTSAVKWSVGATSDPFSDISGAQTKILQNSGLEANVLVLSYGVYQALRLHPGVIDRIKYTMGAEARNINEQLLAAAFDVDEVLVSKAVYNTSQEGVAGSYSFVMGNHALLAHRTAAPSLQEASAGYIMSWTNVYGAGNNMGVASWQVPMPVLGPNTIRIEAAMAFDMQVIAPEVGYFFSGIA
jgi:hypothetical protein